MIAVALPFRHPGDAVRVEPTVLDRRMADRCINGTDQDRQDVLSALYEEHSEAVYNFLYRLTNGREEEAADFMQDAFVKAYKALPTIREDTRFKPWLYRIAHNVFLDAARHNKLVRFCRLDALFGGAFIGRSIGSKQTDFEASPEYSASAVHRYGDQLTDQARDDQPAQAVLDSEAQEDVQRVLDTLHPKYRMVLVLREYHDLSYDEIAEILNTTRAAIKSLLFRARNEFRAQWPKLVTDTDLVTQAVQPAQPAVA